MVALLNLPKANSWSSVHSSSWYCAFVCSCLCIVSKENFGCNEMHAMLRGRGGEPQRQHSACTTEEPEQMLLIRFVSEELWYVVTGSEHLWRYQNLAPLTLLGTWTFKYRAWSATRKEKKNCDHCVTPPSIPEGRTTLQKIISWRERGKLRRGERDAPLPECTQDTDRRKGRDRSVS